MLRFYKTIVDLSSSGEALGPTRAALTGRLLILLPFFVVALQLLQRAGYRLRALIIFPFPHDSLEGTLLYEARLLWSGHPLYQPLELYRFVSAPYPPLHSLLLGVADQIAGKHIFWGGRLLSLAAAIGISVLIVLLVWQSARSWAAGIIGAGLFLSAPPVLLWATRIKPDMTALFLTTLGLYCAARSLASEQELGGREPEQSLTPKAQSSARYLGAQILFDRWLLGALVCFVLAMFTKQTMVIAPFAAGLALLTADIRSFLSGRREGYVRFLPLRWRTLLFGLLYLGLILLIWLILDLITAGNYTGHVWGLHRSEWWSTYLLQKYVWLLAPYWPLMLIGAGVLVTACWQPRLHLFAWYLLFAPISLLGAAEAGANHNHLMETLLALTIGGGALLGTAVAARGRWLLLLLPLLVLFSVQLRLAFEPQPWFIGELKPPDPPERFLMFIQNTPGEVLADDVALLLQAGRDLRYNDPSTMGPAAMSGVWDQRGLLDDIAQKRFSAIMLPIDVCTDPFDVHGRWSIEAMRAVCEHYQLKFKDRIRVYVPKEP